MDFNNIDFPEIPNIALGKVIPDSVRIRQMEEEIENERYQELANKIGSIEEYSKSQAKSAENEIFFLKQQLELTLQRAVDAESGERKANFKSNIAIVCAIISAICAILSLL